MARQASTLAAAPIPTYGVATRVLRRLAWPALCRVAPGHLLRLPLASGEAFTLRLGDQVSRMLFEHGVYEPHLTALLLPLVRPGMTVFDIGANIGYYTTLLARRVGPQGAVHAFEVNDQVLEVLEVNVRRAHLTNVTVVKQAVTAQTGTAHFFVPRAGDEAEGSLQPSTRYDAGRVVQVPTVSLDDYVHAQGIARVDLIKLDIEGAEYEALQGATHLLASKDKPVLLFEALDSACVNFGRTWYEVVQVVQQLGYRIHQGDAANFIATPWR